MSSRHAMRSKSNWDHLHCPIPRFFVSHTRQCMIDEPIPIHRGRNNLASAAGRIRALRPSKSNRCHLPRPMTPSTPRQVFCRPHRQPQTQGVFCPHRPPRPRGACHLHRRRLMAADAFDHNSQRLWTWQNQICTEWGRYIQNENVRCVIGRREIYGGDSTLIAPLVSSCHLQVDR